MMSTLKPSFRPVYCGMTESIFNPIPEIVLDFFTEIGCEPKLIGRLSSWEIEAMWGMLGENVTVRATEWGYSVCSVRSTKTCEICANYFFNFGEEEALKRFLNRLLEGIDERSSTV